MSTVRDHNQNDVITWRELQSALVELGLYSGGSYRSGDPVTANRVFDAALRYRDEPKLVLSNDLLPVTQKELEQVFTRWGITGSRGAFGYFDATTLARAVVQNAYDNRHLTKESDDPFNYTRNFNASADEVRAAFGKVMKNVFGVTEQYGKDNIWVPILEARFYLGTDGRIVVEAPRRHRERVEGVFKLIQQELDGEKGITRDELAKALRLLGYGVGLAKRVYEVVKEDYPENTVVRSQMGQLYQRRGSGWVVFGNSGTVPYDEPTRPLTVVN